MSTTSKPGYDANDDGAAEQITELIPSDILHRFLRRQMKCKVLLVAVSGAHAYGYPHSKSPLELKGIHIENTERLVGLRPPPKAYNWIGEFEDLQIDYSSLEIGTALELLLRGDGSVLERILAPRQLLKGPDLDRLQAASRGILCRRFHQHYRNFCKGVLRDYDETEEQRNVAHLLGAYRTALTGVHLLREAELELDLMVLARRYGFEGIDELVKLNCRIEGAVLDEKNPWINRLVRLHGLLEESDSISQLPLDPPQPTEIEEYLLDMRRRFFDALTIQQ